jgi:hypothetical protein
MSPEQLAGHAQWKPSSGHPKGWRATRQFFPPLQPKHGEPNFQEAKGPKGKLRLFKSYEAAQRAADKLNAQENSR